MVQQIVTIVNQSGKIVKSSKQLVNVFNEAKTAYNERKAELKAGRQRDDKHNERKARRQLDVLTIEDDDASSQRSGRSSLDGQKIKRKPVPSSRERPPTTRGVSDSFYVNDSRESGSPKKPTRSSTLDFDNEGRLKNHDPRVGELVRRHTDLDLTLHKSRSTRRRASLDDIDMDLAYGELPPPLPARRGNDTIELREKMTSLQQLLDEANCIQHSVTAIIENLSKNPDTMAAVALTLGEISALASKLAPGALTALKGSFPAIIAILASPEFAIAAGVGIGVTIIAFGGYKIIKKIQARKDNDRGLLAYEAKPLSPTESMDELRELSAIDKWRKGIAEAEAGSAGTSVDGEFITPIATRTLIEQGKLTEADLKSTTSSRKSRRRKSVGDEKTGNKSRSKASGRSMRSKKEKPPSRLSMLFKAS